MALSRKKYGLKVRLCSFKEAIDEIKDGYLKITANRNTNNEEKDKDGKIIRQERFTGSCSRSFYVGENIKEEDIKANFDNGELKITFPSNTPKQVEEKKYIPIE